MKIGPYQREITIRRPIGMAPDPIDPTDIEMRSVGAEDLDPASRLPRLG
jgi:hypothetical protein